MTNIHAITNIDLDKWKNVYRFYSGHYQFNVTDEGIRIIRDQLTDANHPLNRIVVEIDRDLVGLAHYRAMPNQLREKNITCDLNGRDRYREFLSPKHISAQPPTSLEVKEAGHSLHPQAGQSLQQPEA